MTSGQVPAVAGDTNKPVISDRRYREMTAAGLDLLDEGVTVFDRDLRLVACNRTFLRLLDFPDTMAEPGLPFEAFIRHNANRGEYGPGDPDAQVRERVEAARAFKPHETRRRRPDGTLLLIRGFPLPHDGFIALYSDITELDAKQTQIERQQIEQEAAIERRTAELTRANAELTAAIEDNRRITAALRFSEARLRQITDTIPAHIAYFDNHWIYRYANRSYAEWFGWTSETMVNKPIRQVIGLQVFEAVEDAVERALGGEEMSYEYSLTAPDGMTRFARSTLVPDIGQDGEVMGCFVHAVDITEQRRTFSALAQAQKMEAIGQLTGGLAHDFNNMLTVVMGNLAGLREALPAHPVIGEFVDPTLEAAERGSTLIKRLLAFSRQQPMAPEPVEVNELVLSMARLIRRSVPGNISILTQSKTDQLVAMVDAHQLESALLNLALNARDAMPNGGALCIESSLEALGRAEAADLELPPGNYVQIAVSDNGMGMDGATVARVFEPFFTTKKFGMGSGLGMAMVYGFIKQSGGGVRIRSRQAVGTTVALILPCAARPATALQLDAPAPARMELKNRLVLLVEDDDDVRKVVRKQLASLGCTVLEAESGNEAADMVENVSSIALVLSDVVMPGGMDGRALARFVRRFRPDLPVVLMSGYASSEPLRRGDDDVPMLDKPFSRDKLAAALTSLGR
jgi:PAS domain S-box-containing protein